MLETEIILAGHISFVSLNLSAIYENTLAAVLFAICALLSA